MPLLAGDAVQPGRLIADPPTLENVDLLRVEQTSRLYFEGLTFRHARMAVFGGKKNGPSGRAPDVGAQEFGALMPWYGPRKGK